MAQPKTLEKLRARLHSLNAKIAIAREKKKERIKQVAYSANTELEKYEQLQSYLKTSEYCSEETVAKLEMINDIMKLNPDKVLEIPAKMRRVLESRKAQARLAIRQVEVAEHLMDEDPAVLQEKVVSFQRAVAKWSRKNKRQMNEPDSHLIVGIDELLEHPKILLGGFLENDNLEARLARRALQNIEARHIVSAVQPGSSNPEQIDSQVTNVSSGNIDIQQAKQAPTHGLSQQHKLSLTREPRKKKQRAMRVYDLNTTKALEKSEVDKLKDLLALLSNIAYREVKNEIDTAAELLGKGFFSQNTNEWGEVLETARAELGRNPSILGEIALMPRFQAYAEFCSSPSTSQQAGKSALALAKSQGKKQRSGQVTKQDKKQRSRQVTKQEGQVMGPEGEGVWPNDEDGDEDALLEVMMTIKGLDEGCFTDSEAL